MNGKKIWESKTFWINVVGLGAIIYQSFAGFVIDASTQAEILMVINLFLRLVTKEAIVWE